MEIYKITRFFASGRSEVVRSGLTLNEAKAHCSDPETSSFTCAGDVGRLRTLRYGPWFDGFSRDENWA